VVPLSATAVFQLPAAETIWWIREVIRKRIESSSNALPQTETVPRGAPKMTAIAHTISNISGIDIDVESLRTVAMFCGVGLVVSIAVCLTYGLDLSPGFF
jgi:hypothetical protein